MADAAANPSGSFPWKRLFDRASEPVFLINRWRRILFVNGAWEQLTRVQWTKDRKLLCKRHRHAEPGSVEALLSVLAPPADVLAGKSARVRRLFTGGESGPQWWTISFLPLQGKNAPLGVLGTIQPDPQPVAAAPPPLPERLVALRERLRVWHQLDGLESAAPAVEKLGEQARLASQLAAPALLVGEPGSGKHWLARVIHQASARGDLSFAALACDGLPPPALAAVLFGDWAGRKPKLGSIYLHEVAALPLDLQERLCQRLAESTAGDGPRWLAGTSRDPLVDVQSGRFKEELYCRLSALTLTVPPLRDRTIDFKTLTARLLARRAAMEGSEGDSIAPEAAALLAQYGWPENLRELLIVLHAACDRAKSGRIEVADLPWHLQAASAPPASKPISLKVILEEVERRLLRLAMARSKNNQAKAAEMLGIWRQLLARRLKALDLTGPEDDDETSAGDRV